MPLALDLALRLTVMTLIFGILIFAPAGTLEYWQGWGYLAAFALPSFFVTFYFVGRDPAFIRRRMNSRETEPRQRVVQSFMMVLFLANMVVPALDHRFRWSHAPAWLSITTDVLIVVGYALIFWVFLENRYAASTIRVEDSQQVVSTGPYALVRHPMYLGAIPMLLLAPLALGSYWGLLISVPSIIVLPFRITNEEAVLVRDLPGYEDYRRSVRWRLIPGVW